MNILLHIQCYLTLKRWLVHILYFINKIVCMQWVGRRGMGDRGSGGRRREGGVKGHYILIRLFRYY